MGNLLRKIGIPDTPLNKGLLTLLPILIVLSILINWHLAEKRQDLAEKDLIARIETAKKRAHKNGAIPDGFTPSYKQLEPYIYRYEKEKPMEELTLGSKNGTGKNIVRWGSFKRDGSGKPVELGAGPPVKD